MTTDDTASSTAESQDIAGRILRTVITKKLSILFCIPLLEGSHKTTCIVQQMISDSEFFVLLLLLLLY